MAVLGNEAASPSEVRMRELWGEELLQARELRDKADLMLAAFKKRYQWSFKRAIDPPPAPDSPAARAEFEEVVAAYRQVIQRFPQTEIAAYANLQLSGVYQYQRDFGRAIEEIKAVADQFRGTIYETKAYFGLGLIELQGRHNPKEAIPWLKKVPPPSAAPADGIGRGNNLSEAGILHMSAQKEIARAEKMIEEAQLAERQPKQGKRALARKKGVSRDPESSPGVVSSPTLDAVGSTQEISSTPWLAVVGTAAMALGIMLIATSFYIYRLQRRKEGVS